jgi:ribonucleoside-diphosphate reductase alpha chain
MLTAEGFYKQPEDATPEVTLRRPADTFSFYKGVKDQQLADRIYHAVINKWFMYSSPVLSNSLPPAEPLTTPPDSPHTLKGCEEEGSGGTRGLPISCFLSMIPDSKEGLVAARSEAAWLSMMGGGISVYASNRSVDTKSTGVMAHLKGYDSDTLAYRQTATRRGSMAAYLDIDHPEIVSFLEMRDPTGGDSNKKCFNLNNATNLTDSYMHAVINGTSYPLIDPKHGATGKTLDAREIWELQMNLRFNTGEPYTTFIDNINNRLPIQITNPDYRVRQSNLCVAPETLILTDKGYLPIASLEGEQVNVWNGREWSNVTVLKTGTNQPLITVTTSSGQELTCTPYHKFYVMSTYTSYIEKRAGELKEGDKLIKTSFPIIQGEDTFPNAYDNGFYTGDGCYSKGWHMVYLYGDKKALKPELNSSIYEKWSDHPDQDRLIGWSKKLLPKFTVPTSNYTVRSKLEWLAGLCDSDGTVARSGKTQSIQICSINKPFLLEIQMMLQTLGIISKLNLARKAGFFMLPDGKGGRAEYFCQEAYRLLIGQSAINTLQDLGFTTHRLSLTQHKADRECSHYNKVVSILDTGRKDDTFCFTEPKRGMGVFNGLLTGQCNEVTLMTSEERTAVCCLSSLNLDKYDEWKDTNLVADLVTFLDNVLEFFIENAHPINLKRAIFSASQERAIGIGTIGFHSYLQSKSIAFESRDAAREAHYIYKDIKDKALAQSIALGAERGVAPDCADRGIASNREGSTYLGTRNSHLLAVAPNASSADLLGELITLKDGTVYDSSPSPSIEPLAANAYNSQGRAGSHLLVNRHLVALLITKDKATPEVIENIIQHKGSVQQLDFLSTHEKNVFKTFTELNPMWVVELAAVRQEHICQSQSVNIRVSNSITLEQMSDIHMSAWQKGLKGLYYCRSEAAGKTNVGTGGDKPLNSVPVTIEYGSCLACEG